MNQKLLLVLSFLFVLTANVSAQNSPDQSIARLKTEISRREVIDADESTPATVKLTNRQNLEKARTALVTAVQNRITTLEKYLNTLGDSITPAEKEEARTILRNLSADMKIANAEPRAAVTSNGSGVAAVPGGSVAPVAASVTVANGVEKSALRIITPPDNSRTENYEVEVNVQIQPATASRTKLKATVTNSGKTIDSKDFSIEKDDTIGKVTLKLSPGENVIKIELADDSTVNATATVTGEDRKTPFTRAIFGIEQAAAASAKPEQKLFLEFNLSAPLFKRNDKPIDAPVWLWLNPRITSLPQQFTSTVAEFATASNFIAPFNNGKVNDVVQGFEFLGGIEKKLFVLESAHDSGFGPQTKVRYGLSLVFAGGMSTPFGSQQVGPQFFKVNDTVRDEFDVPEGKDFIAFVSADRNRFFRQYYAGLRLKSYFVRNNDYNCAKDDKNDVVCKDLDNIFPGIIDITFGQNESVTGGSLHGGIVRIDGIYPLPFIRGKYRGSIYVFGSALMKLNKPRIPPPVILQPPETSPEFPSDKVFIQQVPPRDADHYRLGVGVDLIRLLKP